MKRESIVRRLMRRWRGKVCPACGERFFHLGKHKHIRKPIDKPCQLPFLIGREKPEYPIMPETCPKPDPVEGWKVTSEVPGAEAAK